MGSGSGAGVPVSEAGLSPSVPTQGILSQTRSRTSSAHGRSPPREGCGWQEAKLGTLAGTAVLKHPFKG